MSFPAPANSDEADDLPALGAAPPNPHGALPIGAADPLGGARRHDPPVDLLGLVIDIPFAAGLKWEVGTARPPSDPKVSSSCAMTSAVVLGGQAVLVTGGRIAVNPGPRFSP